MRYNIAPIREAIFDIRIDNLGKSNNISDLEELHSLISDVYPDKKKQISFVGKIEIKNNVQINNETNQEIKGFVFLNSKSNCQVQYRLDGFTFNMLSPYSEWKEFSEEAFRLWSIYEKELQPNNIVRIALRYINRIEIPLPMEKFQDYILNIPPIPKNLPKSFRNFFMQIDVPCDIDGTNVVLTETIEQATKDKLPFILDIDAYKVGKINKDIKTLQFEFDKLRDLKNSTFESSITKKTRNLFN